MAIKAGFPQRKNIRLDGYDYSLANAYFITICTDRLKNLFWNDVGASIARPPHETAYSEYGEIAARAIESIPLRYPAVSVDNYVIMPNHIHLLLRINTLDDGRAMLAPTVSIVVQQMKGSISKQVGFPLWQKGFHDHIVRGHEDYREIWEYIENNPAKWAEDKLFEK